MIYIKHKKMPYTHKKKKYDEGPHLFETNVYYFIQYNQLLRDMNVWNGSGQYWLGKECERRANCLLKNDIPGYEQVKHSDELFYKTKKFQDS